MRRTHLQVTRRGNASGIQTADFKVAVQEWESGAGEWKVFGKRAGTLNGTTSCKCLPSRQGAAAARNCLWGAFRARRRPSLSQGTGGLPSRRRFCLVLSASRSPPSRCSPIACTASWCPGTFAGIPSPIVGRRLCPQECAG